MRFGTFLGVTCAFFLIVGVLDLLTNYVTLASLWLNDRVGTISHIFLLIVVLISVARGATLVVEQRKGTLPIERAQARSPPPDLVGTFGVTITGVIDSFTAYILFVTGFAIMVVDLSGKLAADSPAIPVEGLTFIFLVSTAMIGGAFWFAYRLLHSVVNSPVFSMQAGEAFGIVTPAAVERPPSPPASGLLAPGGRTASMNQRPNPPPSGRV
jgi:hypothetical protein